MSELYESIGRNPADCAVCAAPTLLRIAVGDGCAPICSLSCERSWPNVRKLLENAGRAETRARELERYSDFVHELVSRDHHPDCPVDDDYPNEKCTCIVGNATDVVMGFWKRTPHPIPETNNKENSK